MKELLRRLLGDPVAAILQHHNQNILMKLPQMLFRPGVVKAPIPGNAQRRHFALTLLPYELPVPPRILSNVLYVSNAVRKAPERDPPRVHAQPVEKVSDVRTSVALH